MIAASCQIFTYERSVRSDTSDGIRVLVVDDYHDTADAIAAVLELEGFDVRVAYRGQAAIEIAQGWLPRIVLLDICMPDISGLEVARRLRESSRTLNAVLIGHSALTAAHDIQAARAAGFDAYCAKPMDSEFLTPLLRRFVGEAVAPSAVSR